MGARCLAPRLLDTEARSGSRKFNPGPIDPTRRVLVYDSNRRSERVAHHANGNPQASWFRDQPTSTERRRTGGGGITNPASQAFTTDTSRWTPKAGSLFE